MDKGPVIRRNVLFLNDTYTAYLWDENEYQVLRDNIVAHSGKLQHYDKIDDLKSRYILARDGLINWSVK